MAPFPAEDPSLFSRNLVGCEKGRASPKDVACSMFPSAHGFGLLVSVWFAPPKLGTTRACHTDGGIASSLTDPARRPEKRIQIDYWLLTPITFALPGEFTGHSGTMTHIFAGRPLWGWVVRQSTGSRPGPWPRNSSQTPPQAAQAVAQNRRIDPGGKRSVFSGTGDLRFRAPEARYVPPGGSSSGSRGGHRRRGSAHQDRCRPLGRWQSRPTSKGGLEPGR